VEVLGDPVMPIVGAGTLALVFAAAAAGKLRAREEFVGVVGNYRLLPGPAVRPVALALPLAEVAVALGLVVPATRRVAAVGAIALLVLFGLAVAVNLLRGRRYIDCGCFRFSMRQPLGWGLVGRNAGLILLGLVPALAGEAARPVTWLDLVTAGAAIGSLFALSVAAGHVAGGPPVAAEAAAL
jgi:hypothetical protein